MLQHVLVTSTFPGQSPNPHQTVSLVNEAGTTKPVWAGWVAKDTVSPAAKQWADFAQVPIIEETR